MLRICEHLDASLALERCDENWRTKNGRSNNARTKAAVTKDARTKAIGMIER